MKNERDERAAAALRVLMTIAIALLFIAIIAWGMGRQSATELYAVIGFRFFIGSLAVFLVAALTWSVNWIKANVKIR